MDTKHTILSDNTSTPANAPQAKEGEFIKAEDFNKYSITIDDGGKSVSMTPLEIGQEAEGVQALHDRAAQNAGELAKHMFLLAKKAGSLPVFLALCDEIKYKLQWGRPPIDMSPAEKKLYKGKPVPVVWKTYKTYITKAMEASIMPDSVIKVKEKNEEGKFIEKPVKVDSVGTMRKLMKGSSTGNAPRRTEGGIHVSSTGNEKAVPASHGVTEQSKGTEVEGATKKEAPALAEARVPVTVAAALAAIADLSTKLEKKDVKKLEQRLQRLLNDMSKMQKEVQEEARSKTA